MHEGMTNAQLYLAIGAPMAFNALLFTLLMIYINAKIAGLDGKIASVNQRIDDLAAALNKRIDDINKRIDDMNKRIDDLRDTLRNEIRAAITEVRFK